MVTIASFNLFNYLAPPGAFYEFENIYTQEQWLRKQAWIIDYLTTHQPDVIGFQEVFSPDDLKTLVASLGYEYFAVVEHPDIVDDFIYSKPVVAIASRYPIVELEAVKAAPALAAAMGLAADFQFSRLPLRASIDLPHFGVCDCYVVHFKSKRPYIEPLDLAVDSLMNCDITQILTQEVMGRWGSSIQRGTESAQLFYAMIERRKQTQYPMLLMGDFNDSLNSDVLAALTTSNFRGHAEVLARLATYRLKDSYHLFHKTDYCPEDCVRHPTHYYGVKGSVLDYIMLSCEFDAEHTKSIAEVCGYQSYDRHLTNPIYEKDSYSTDHAPVMVSLKPRQ